MFVDLGGYLGAFCDLLLRGEGVVAGRGWVVGGVGLGAGCCVEDQGEYSEFQGIFARAGAQMRQRLDCMDSCSFLLAAAQGANRRWADPV